MEVSLLVISLLIQMLSIECCHDTLLKLQMCPCQTLKYMLKTFIGSLSYKLQCYFLISLFQTYLYFLSHSQPNTPWSVVFSKHIHLFIHLFTCSMIFFYNISSSSNVICSFTLFFKFIDYPFNQCYELRIS